MEDVLVPAERQRAALRSRLRAVMGNPQHEGFSIPLRTQETNLAELRSAGDGVSSAPFPEAVCAISRVHAGVAQAGHTVSCECWCSVLRSQESPPSERPRSWQFWVFILPRGKQHLPMVWRGLASLGEKAAEGSSHSLPMVQVTVASNERHCDSLCQLRPCPVPRCSSQEGLGARDPPGTASGS